MDQKIMALTVAFIATSCSTAAEPAEEGPPLCDCAPGERTLICRTGEYTMDGEYTNSPTNSQYTRFCFDEEATDEQKEQACLDACNEWLVDLEGKFQCGFLMVSDPIRWAACIAPEAGTTSSGVDTSAGADTTTSADFECPDWYAPHLAVTSYEPLTPTSASVQLDRPFLDQLIVDPLPLYTCDSARYEESAPGQWTFVDVEPSDLLHHLGLRTGDGIATVQGIDPLTHHPTTAAYRLDSVDTMLAAYTALEHASALRLTIERDGAFDISVSLVR